MPTSVFLIVIVTDPQCRALAAISARSDGVRRRCRTLRFSPGPAARSVLAPLCFSETPERQALAVCADTDASEDSQCTSRSILHRMFDRFRFGFEWPCERSLDALVCCLGADPVPTRRAFIDLPKEHREPALDGPSYVSIPHITSAQKYDNPFNTELSVTAKAWRNLLKLSSRELWCSGRACPGA
jgi:hypothetical protein